MAFDITKTGIALPARWTTKVLSEVADVNFDTIKKCNEPREIFYIDISSVSQGSHEKPTHMSYAEAPSRAKRRLKSNDIIISTVRPNLRQYVLIEEVGANWVASTGFCVVSPHDAKTAWFLYSVLTSEYFTEHLVRVADGGAYPAFNPKEVEDAVIPWPNSDDLLAINTIVKNIANKCSLNSKINQTLEEMAQGIFKSWFVDFDPVRAKAETLERGGTAEEAEQAAMCAISGRDPAALRALQSSSPDQYQELAATAALFPSAFEDSPLGPIPQGWRCGCFENLCVKVESGGTPKRSVEQYWGGAIKWLTSGEVRDVVVTDTKEKITAEGVSDSSAKLWPRYTTVVAMYGATAGQVCLLANEMTTNQACCGLIPKEYLRAFTFLAARREINSLADKASGSAQQNLNKGLVASHETIVPSEKVASAFERIGHCFLDMWISNINCNEQLANIRDSLLPKLLSGEIDVSQLEGVAAD